MSDFDVFRCLVPKCLMNRRGVTGGGCFTKVLHFLPWPGFCYMVRSSSIQIRKEKKKEKRRNNKVCLGVRNWKILSFFGGWFWSENSRRLIPIWAYSVWFLIIGKEESIHQRCMIRGTSPNLDRWFLILHSWRRVCLTHAKYRQQSYSWLQHILEFHNIIEGVQS